MLSRYAKIYRRIMSGASDHDITLLDMAYFLSVIGAVYERTAGDHVMYGIPGIPEKVNIQPVDGKLKAYQVKQIRKLVNKYGLGGIDHESL